jgi:hypothetical protein
MGRNTPKSTGKNVYKHSVNFDAKGDTHSRRDMKAYIKNREYAPHLNKIYICTVTGISIFIALLYSGISQMHKDNAPLFLLLGSLATVTTFGENAYSNHTKKIRNVLFPSANEPSWLILCAEEGAIISPKFVQVAKKLYETGYTSLNGTTRLSLGVVNCKEHKYLPNMFLSSKDQMPKIKNINPKSLLSLEHGLHLSPKSSSSKQQPMMFITSYRRKTYQLSELEMKSMQTIIQAIKNHNNYNLMLKTIKSNKQLYSRSCLEESNKKKVTGHSEVCIFVLRRGELEDDVRESIKKVMITHRHFNWVRKYNLFSILFCGTPNIYPPFFLIAYF